MKSLTHIAMDPALTIAQLGPGGGQGYIKFKTSKRPAVVVWSFGGGWEHVSVSFAHRCPTWDEMCRVKDMFWREDETVVQYHPAKNEYINMHPYCLHLWRPVREEIPVPPSIFVGVKGTCPNG